MIVECYSADVYCDCADHKHLTPGCYSQADTFTGKSKADTDKARRAAGWVKINGQDVCAICRANAKDKPLKMKPV